MVLTIVFYAVMFLAIYFFGRMIGYRLAQKGYSEDQTKRLVWNFRFSFILILILLSLVAWGYRTHFLSVNFTIIGLVPIVLFYAWTMRKINRL